MIFCSVSTFLWGILLLVLIVTTGIYLRTNALMAFHNLISLLGLSGVIIYETKKIQEKLKEEKEAAKSI
ncbi:hypothetical protein [Psychrobacillus sp. BM2]|uniref:hypothetical protein n=1 Tax=Psychrobacillus sp. BM2 TaxID=3400421 RepID=UPI003B01047C